MLLELAERCEKATGPDRELDWAIFNAEFFDATKGREPAYTTSLDAAMTLVPEGAGINLERYWTRQREEWACIMTWGLKGRNCRVEAASAALALCAAALRARSTNPNTERQSL